MLYEHLIFHHAEDSLSPHGSRKYYFEIKIKTFTFLYIYTFKDLSGWALETAVDKDMFLIAWTAITENQEYIKQEVHNYKKLKR